MADTPFPPPPGCCLGCGLPYGWQRVYTGLYRAGNDATVREEREASPRTWTAWTKKHGTVAGYPDAQAAMLDINKTLADDGWSGTSSLLGFVEKALLHDLLFSYFVDGDRGGVAK